MEGRGPGSDEPAPSSCGSSQCPAAVSRGPYAVMMCKPKPLNRIANPLSNSLNVLITFMKNPKKQRLVPVSLPAGLILALVLAFARTPAAAPSNPPARLNIQDAPLSHDVKLATSFAPIVKKVAPAVVN